MREADTLSGVANRHGVQPNLVRDWRKQAKEIMVAGFRNGTPKSADGKTVKALHEVHAKMGELTLEKCLFVVCRGAEHTGAAGPHRSGRPIEHIPAMSTARRGAQVLLTARPADAGARLDAPGVRIPADKAGLGTRWRDGRPAPGACAVSYASWVLWRLRRSPPPAWPRPHRLYPGSGQLHVLGGGDELGHALRAVLATVELHGCRFLRGRPAGGAERPSCAGIFNTDQGRNSRAPPSRAPSRRLGRGCRWTGAGGGWTIGSSSVCGARSSVRRCTCTTCAAPSMRAASSAIGPPPQRRPAAFFATGRNAEHGLRKRMAEGGVKDLTKGRGRGILP